MSATDENAQRCPALRKRDGQPCSGKPTSSGYCIAHDPKANEWRARGGSATGSAARAAKTLPSSLRPIAEGLHRAFFAMEGQPAEVKWASTMASIASALVRVYQATEYEQRLRVLEQQAADYGMMRDRYGKDRSPLQWPIPAED